MPCSGDPIYRVEARTTADGSMVSHVHTCYTTVVTGNTSGVVTTSIVSDLLGRKTSMVDPDMGTWSYEYNAFGELIKQTNAMRQYSVMTYDLLGRMETRHDYLAGGGLEGHAAWTYDMGPSETGRISQEDHTYYPAGGGTETYQRVFDYDAYGRSQQVTTTIDGNSYIESTTYDQFGRVFQSFDATGLQQGEEYRYNDFNYLEALHEAADNTKIYYEIESLDARGNALVTKKGGVTVMQYFDPQNGQIEDIEAFDLLWTQYQDLSYSFDSIGNLEWREDNSRQENGTTLKDLREDFTYDDLNRLTGYTAYDGSTQIANRTVTYDDHGNITNKSDVGNYAYGSSRPHAVTNAGSANYGYNANGSMISGSGRAIEYTVFNKPSVMSKYFSATHIPSVKIFYGPNRNRYKRIDNSNEGTTIFKYVGNVEFIERVGQYTEEKRYIGGEVIVTKKTTSTTTTTTEHLLLTDHLGSTHMILESNQGLITVAQNRAFDPWGKRLTGDTWSASFTTAMVFALDDITTRGFTGHEGLDAVGLIHMNGRVYDPFIGRFVSADPFVQAPGNTQSYNRYSYLMNNPLNATDPSGFFLKKLFEKVPFLAQAIQITACALGGVPACGLAAFGTTLAASGDLKSAIISGVTAAAFSALGGKFSGLEKITAGKIALYSIGAGALGGVSTVLQGGKFGHGFVTAGLSFAAGATGAKHFSSTPKFQKAFQAAVSGTISKATGGKFANGAAFSAFAMAMTAIKPGLEIANGDDFEKATAEELAFRDYIRKRIRRTVFKSREQLSRYVVKRLGPAASAFGGEGTEFSALMVDAGNGRVRLFGIGVDFDSGSAGSSLAALAQGASSAGLTAVGDLHYHTVHNSNANLQFSGTLGDIKAIANVRSDVNFGPISSDYRSYIGTPKTIQSRSPAEAQSLIDSGGCGPRFCK